MQQLRNGLLVSVVMFLVIVTCFDIRFDVNDDYGAVCILSGADGFEAQPDVPFVSRIFNTVLFHLYRMFPSVTWYGALLYLAIVLGNGLFLALLFNQQLDPLTRLFAAPAIIGFAAHCLYLPSFTCASLLLLLGTFLHVISLMKSEQEDPNWWSAAGCCALAYLWRWKMALVLGVFGLPMLLYMRRHDLRALIPMLLLVGVVGGDRLLDKRYHEQAGQQEFADYSRLRSRFHDRPAGRIAGQDTPVAAAGWHPDDYRMFREQWVLYDEQLFNAQSLQQFLAANAAHAPSLPRRVVHSVKQSIGLNKPYLLLTFVTGVTLLLCRWHDRRSFRDEIWRRDVLGFLIVVGLTLFLVYYRFVPRVSVPVLLYFLGWCVILFQPNISARLPFWDRATNHRLALTVGLLASLGVSGWLVASELGDSAERIAEKRMSQRCLNEFLRRTGPSATIIRMELGRAFRYDAVHPFRREPVWNRLRVIPSGWQIGSKRYRDILSSLRIKTGRQLLQKAIDAPVYLVQLTAAADQQEKTRALWQSYYNRNLVDEDQRVTLRQVFRCKQGDLRALAVYRVETIKQRVP